MKIKMLTMMAGPQGVRQAGKIYDVPLDEAKVLIAGRYAVAVEKEAPDDTSIQPGVETEEMQVPSIEKAVRRGKKKA